MKKNLFTAVFFTLTTTLTPYAAEKTAIFAGGCFWCIQHDFADYEEKGFIKTEVGFTGGRVKNPSYNQVSKTDTGHYEALKITYDDTKITYETLLSRFWPNVDATDNGGQFCDRGQGYSPAVFVANKTEKEAAEKSRTKAQKILGDAVKINTPILPAAPFYLAEDYHQHYAAKNPIRYNYYRKSCGRDKRIKALWGDLENI